MSTLKYLLIFSVHNRSKSVCCWLRSDPDSGKVSFQQISDKRGLSCGVLAHQQHHRLGVKVRLIERRRHELVEVLSLLKWQQLALVNLLQTLGHSCVELGLSILLPLEE